MEVSRLVEHCIVMIMRGVLLASEVLPSQRVEALETSSSTTADSEPIALENGPLYDRSSVYPRNTIPDILDDNLPLG